MKAIVLSLFALAYAAFVFVGCGAYNQQGPQGIPGTNGSGCTVSTIGVGPGTPNGGALITCATTSSLVLNGTNGTAGTIVAPVQFCPAATSYPGTFSEVGFCIGGNLYAVYSANDGFLSAIPNGNYTSNGINSSCNFTVTGCTVQDY
jgi:hypothetical protein